LRRCRAPNIARKWSGGGWLASRLKFQTGTRFELRSGFPHDGQITESCLAPFAKIFLFFRNANQRYIVSCPVPPGGALRNVIDAGRDAVDADGAGDDSAGGGRRSRVVLTPRRWRQVRGRQIQ